VVLAEGLQSSSDVDVADDERGRLRFRQWSTLSAPVEN